MTNLLETIVRAADDKKALDIVALDMKAINGVTDYFVIMEAMNSRQLEAIIDHIADVAKQQMGRSLQWEGDSKSGWVLLDLGTLVVNVFSHEERYHYNLEKLWHDAPLVDLSAYLEV